MKGGLVCQGEFLITACAVKGVDCGRARHISYRTAYFTARFCEKEEKGELTLKLGQKTFDRWSDKNYE
jgi:hypothetical protein